MILPCHPITSLKMNNATSQNTTIPTTSLASNPFPICPPRLIWHHTLGYIAFGSVSMAHGAAGASAPSDPALLPRTRNVGIVAQRGAPTPFAAPKRWVAGRHCGKRDKWESPCLPSLWFRMRSKMSGSRDLGSIGFGMLCLRSSVLLFVSWELGQGT